MSLETPVSEHRRGREARRVARAKRGAVAAPYLVRALPLTEVLSAEGLEIIERNAETLLQEDRHRIPRLTSTQRVNHLRIRRSSVSGISLVFCSRMRRGTSSCQSDITP